MTKVKYCTKCVWSATEGDSSWNLVCTHPVVNAKDEWALASKNITGSSCRSERAMTWIQFPSCGKAGKLWEENVV